MNKKGQAALEYLMTYGWALIVIAIVVGVLVFIVMSPTGDVRCASAAPDKINVLSNNVPLTATTGAAIGSIVIQNLTGGQATSVTCSGGTNYFAATACAAPGTLPVGNTTLVMAAGAVGSPTTGTFIVNYTDVAELIQTVTITCQGATVAIVA